MEYTKGFYWVKYQNEITIAEYYGDLGWDILTLREGDTPKNMEGVEILEKCERRQDASSVPQANELLPHVSGSAFEQVIKLLDGMNADERMDVFAEYCTYCGDKDPSCQCWNDE